MSFSPTDAAPRREEFIYRINDSSQGVEAAQHRKHVLDGVRNSGQLWRGVDGGKKGEETRSYIREEYWMSAMGKYCV